MEYFLPNSSPYWHKAPNVYWGEVQQNPFT
jgi:hypothetical protein